MSKITVLLIVFLLSFNAESFATAMDVSFDRDLLGEYPSGTNITNQFFDKGIIFSNETIGLEGGFISLGWQENRISSGELMDNPFRIDFIYPEPVVSVSATLHDGSIMSQIHSLFAFDRLGNIIAWAGFADTLFTNGAVPDSFILTVSSLSPIVSVLFYEQNYGADYGKNGGFGYEALSHLSYTTQVAPVSEPETMLMMGAGLIGLAVFSRRKFKTN